MKKLVLATLVFSLVTVACSSSESNAEPTVAPTTTIELTTTEATTTTTTTPPTTTTTLSPDEIAQNELEADTKLIKTLFRRLSDSWYGGVDDASAYMARNVYPDLLCTFESISEGNTGLSDGFQEEHIVDGDSIERDDGWTMPDGPSKGEAINGRLYIFTDEFTYSATGLLPTVERAEVHATVVDGKAYFFFACWPDDYDE